MLFAALLMLQLVTVRNYCSGAKQTPKVLLVSTSSCSIGTSTSFHHPPHGLLQLPIKLWKAGLAGGEGPSCKLAAPLSLHVQTSYLLSCDS